MATSKKPTKAEYLSRPIEMFDITSKAFDTRGIIEAYSKGGCSARDIARAANAYDRMLTDPECTIQLTIAGTGSGFGLMEVWPTMIKSRMVDSVVATGASLIDMDVYHALGGNHYQGNKNWDNEHLRQNKIDRLYDSAIDEDFLQKVDALSQEMSNRLEARPYAPNEVLWELGKALDDGIAVRKHTLLQEAYRQGVPVFCPGLTDSAWGMGQTYHEVERSLKGEAYMTLNTGRDNTDATKLKVKAGVTGIFMVGGGVPSNFVQDTVIVGEGLTDRFKKQLGINYPATHKYAVKVTVADERDGGLSGSTIDEASSWGKIDARAEAADNRVMVFGETTATMPIIAGALYHGRKWETRQQHRWADWLRAHPEAHDFDMSVQKPKKTAMKARAR